MDKIVPIMESRFLGMGYSYDSPMKWLGEILELQEFVRVNEINKMLSIAMLLKKASKGEIDLTQSLARY